MAKDYFSRRELQAIGLSEPMIRTLEKSAELSETIDTLNSTVGDVEDAGTAIVALQAADVAIDGRLDVLEAAGPYVEQDVGPTWGAVSGTLSRAAYASYTAPTISNPPTQAEVQGVADQVQLISRVLAAVLTDLLDNHALTP